MSNELNLETMDSVLSTFNKLVQELNRIKVAEGRLSGGTTTKIRVYANHGEREGPYETPIPPEMVAAILQAKRTEIKVAALIALDTLRTYLNGV